MKMLSGTWRADRDPDGRTTPPTAPLPAAGQLPQAAPALPCPEDLSEDAKAIWCEVTAEMQRVGVLGMTVSSMIELYVSTAARAKQYEAIAAAEPMIETKAGRRLHPAGVEARKLTKLVERLAMQLGLSYAAKSRTGRTAQPQDPEAAERRAKAEAFLFGKARIMVIPGGKDGA
jgi:P27 family predicted phage terminase small subunit